MSALTVDLPTSPIESALEGGARPGATEGARAELAGPVSGRRTAQGRPVLRTVAGETLGDVAPGAGAATGTPAPGPGPSSAADLSGTNRPRVRLVPSLPPARAPEPAPARTAPPTVTQRIAVLRAADRSTIVEAADDERGAVPDVDPTVVARAVGLAAVDVLAGRRPVAQLARWVTPGVYEAIQRRAVLTSRARHGRVAARTSIVRAVRACAIDEHVHEASLVVDDGTRVRAVALRFESHRGSWRATALDIG
ncbi:Rv3235 family protein [Cellulomonas sp. HZM]|uniref:Rv3235 family protein n=1 Tax=Cellulomonas sp. HZM TaxID=1454010 RepID=UPI000689A4C0|nr:Rv3235 family protein [Cellulomonas sp. HZM]